MQAASSVLALVGLLVGTLMVVTFGVAPYLSGDQITQYMANFAFNTLIFNALVDPVLPALGTTAYLLTI